MLGVKSLITYQMNPDVDNEALNALFGDAWPNHAPRDFSPVLSRNLGHVCAMADGVLVGFVNVAWAGNKHAFLLDPTVRSDFQRQGVGTQLVRRAIDLARSKGVEWLHVDYDPRLAEFYTKCGFRTTESGLMNLKEGNTEPSVSGDAWQRARTSRALNVIVRCRAISQTESRRSTQKKQEMNLSFVGGMRYSSST